MRTRTNKPLRSLACALVCALTALPLAAQQADLSEQDITNAVSDELMGDPAIGAHAVEVETDDGVVTLSGDVPHVLAKERAEDIASMVKGVEAIINRIDVRAPVRADTEIQEDIEDALLADAATESWEIVVDVDLGRATLTGSVDSWQEKQLAGTLAKSVQGVTGLQNDITVDYETDRMDREIEKEIEAALDWDAYIDDALISVSVEDSEVSLSGTVGSVAEKNRAFNKAWVAGVRSVDDDGLQIEWWARNEVLREDKYVARSEEEIRNAVNKAFLYDPRVPSATVDVEVDAGTVTLRGAVDNLKARRAAARDARNVVGVWSVRNQLMVRADNVSDARIERSVEDAIRRDPYLNRYDIVVSVTDGEVYLYGSVDSTFEKSTADTIASRQIGAVAVHNHLAVNTDTVSRYGPYSDEPYLYDYDWYEPETQRGGKSDWELRRDIVDELFWSPFVDRADVDVEVEDGVATLRGTVDTWNERQAARENAFEAGAVGVDNNLTVEYGPDYYSP